MKKNKSKKLNNRGMTLIEIMIVLAIIGMIFSFVGANVMNRFKEAKGETAKIQVASFKQALDGYYLAKGKYPKSSEGGMNDLLKDGHLSKEVPKDPWGNEYNYECSDGQNFTITSSGPDGTPGNEDDIKI